MTYINAVKHINTLPATQGIGGERIKSLCSAISAPHKHPKIIRICGDAGKTSCSQMLTSILSECGYKVGQFSPSPLGEMRECISINQKEISHTEFADIAKKVLDYASKLEENISQGEALLAVALIYFSLSDCDTVILERKLSDESPPLTDAPILSIITSIFDIDARSTFEELVPRGTKETVTCIQHKPIYEVISKACADVGCRLSLPIYADLEVKKISLFSTRFTYRSAEYSLNAFSPCQLLNAITIIEAAHALMRLGMNISDDSIRLGLSNARLPLMCRVLAIEPTLIVATVENELQLETLLASLAQVGELLHNKLDVFVSPDSSSLTLDLPSRLASCNINCAEPQKLNELSSHEYAPQINKIISPIAKSENTDYAALFIGEKAYTRELEAQINKVLGRFA